MAEREYKRENKTQKASMKKKKESNKMLEVSEDIQEMMAKEYFDKLPTVIESKKEAFATALGKFANSHNAEIEQKFGKINTLSLENTLCRSFYSNGGGVTTKYDSDTLLISNEYYWDCVDSIMERGIVFIPTLQQFCRLLGISVATFKNYVHSPDEQMRNAIEIIKDRFISFYTARSMTREISEVMSIFTLKASYGMRDNDPQISFVQNNNYTMDDREEVNRLKEKVLGAKPINLDDLIIDGGDLVEE